MIKKGVFILLALYIIVFFGFYFFQEYIIFQPKKLPLDYKYSFNVNFEEVNFKTLDNATLNALHFKVENPKGVILYFHGNKDNLERWGDIASKLTKYNYDVFIMDYRGYGKSTGTRTQKLMYQDAQLSYDYLKEQYKENTIVVYGRSLGGTFASFVASTNNPRLLILEATFNSLLKVVRAKFPLLPYSKILKFKFNSSEFISTVNCPILIFHGVNDRLISIEQAEELFSHSNTDKTTFVKIENGTHHNLMESSKYSQYLDFVLSGN